MTSPKKHKIMIVGLGSLAGYLLDFLARTPHIPEIVVASRDKKRMKEKVNIARIGAGLMGFFPRISWVRMDLHQTEKSAKTIKEIEPTVVVNATRYLKGIKYGGISFPQGLGYGSWIPWSLVLSYKLMLAVDKSGLKPFVINTSYSDGVVPALTKIGLGPTIGIGNLYHLIPRVKMAVSKKMKVPMENIDVYMVGSHFLDVIVSNKGTAAGSPYFLKVLVYGEDVTKKLGADNILSWCSVPCPHGPERNLMAASSTARTVLAHVFDTNEVIHAPAPNGLIGGYPVRINAKGVKVVLPSEISLRKAIKINKESLSFDGIEKIKRDGTIVYTAKNARRMREIYGFKQREFNVRDCEKVAQELYQLVKKKEGW